MTRDEHESGRQARRYQLAVNLSSPTAREREGQKLFDQLWALGYRPKASP